STGSIAGKRQSAGSWGRRRTVVEGGCRINRPSTEREPPRGGDPSNEEDEELPQSSSSHDGAEVLTRPSCPYPQRRFSAPPGRLGRPGPRDCPGTWPFGPRLVETWQGSDPGCVSCGHNPMGHVLGTVPRTWPFGTRLLENRDGRQLVEAELRELQPVVVVLPQVVQRGVAEERDLVGLRAGTGRVERGADVDEQQILRHVLERRLSMPVAERDRLDPADE